MFLSPFSFLELRFHLLLLYTLYTQGHRLRVASSLRKFYAYIHVLYRRIKMEFTSLDLIFFFPPSFEIPLEPASPYVTSWQDAPEPTLWLCLTLLTSSEFTYCAQPHTCAGVLCRSSPVLHNNLAHGSHIIFVF